MSANGELVATPSAGTAIKVGFGERTLTTQAETSATAVAAQQTAMVQAAFIMAERRPRNFDQIRVLLLKTCKRPRFAEAARFLKPVGKEFNEETGDWEQKIAEGLSIRFAEEAARTMGNLRIDSYTLYDDPRRKIVKFVVLDLESNLEWSRTVTLEKTTERKKLKKGQPPLGTRQNSYGDMVFIVEATQEDMTKREGAEASKGWRDGILKNIPADIKEECLDEIRKTIANDAAEDPEQKKKNMLDAFAGIGVEPIHLREYVGHELATLSPAEIVELRGLFSSIRDGETTWGAIIDARREANEEKERAAGKKDEKTATAANGKPSADAAVKAAREKREKAEKEAKEKPVVTAANTPPAADPANLISTGKAAESSPPAPPVTEFVMSTSKQRTELVRALTEAQLGLHEVTEKYGVAAIANLSHAQAEEALAWVKSVTGEASEPGSEG